MAEKIILYLYVSLEGEGASCGSSVSHACGSFGRPANIAQHPASQDEMAGLMLRWIPERAQALIRQHSFAGGVRVKLDDEVTRPTWKDLAPAGLYMFCFW